MARPKETSRKSFNLMIDNEIRAFLNDLPRGVSLSDIVNVVLGVAFEEIKLGRVLTVSELYKWFEKDSRRKKARDFIENKLGRSVLLLRGKKERIVNT